MPVECPNCREPIPRIRLFLTTAWGRWRCSRCGSLLGIDVRRRFLAMIPYFGILILLFWFGGGTARSLTVALPAVVVLGLVNFMLFDRAVVHERTGFRCQKCGYDLQGQVEARCPECGSDFESTELAAYKDAGPIRPPAVRWSRWRIAGVVFMIALTILLVLGLVYFRRARTVPVAAPAPAPVLPQTAPQEL